MSARTPARAPSVGRQLLQQRRHTSCSSAPLRILLTSLALLSLSAAAVDAALLQGCNFDETLCDRAADESCVPDGLFGQCYSAAEAELLKPLILEAPLNELQSELLRLELTRLANSGYDWPHARAQCVLAYFKLSIAYQLDYDTEFCSVRNPSNIWELIQRVQGAIAVDEDGDEESAAAADDDAIVPVVLLDDEQEGAGSQPRHEELYELVAPPQLPLDDDQSGSDAEDEAALRGLLRQLIRDDRQKKADPQTVDDALMETLNERPAAAESEQLQQLAGFIEALQAAQAQDGEEGEEGAAVSAPEVVAQEAALTAESSEQPLLLKKDAEVASAADLGLANTLHKIVKGGIQRVEGSRVYLRVQPKANMSEEELYKLIAYLDKRIAAPNELFFDEFLFDADQLSFRVSRLQGGERPPAAERAVHLHSASGVAKAVYKRRKDIQSLAGLQVDETGIGSGHDVVPVERRDVLFVPILAVCALTIASLLSVLAVQLYRNRKHGAALGKSYLPQVIDHIEGKAASVYEELCRHRMHQDAPTSVKVVASKHSSTSSYPDECLLQSSQLNIATGHVLLSFLQQFLDKPEEITDQWRSVEHYANADATTVAGAAADNVAKNYDAAVLPYDESLVQLQSVGGGDGAESSANGYINASAIYDSDPRQVAYIATQSPMESTGADFWQLVWDQGVALIVNLTDKADEKDGRCLKYWPEEGAKAFGQFEVHLVSEHIWSEDYVVRSLYLKNLATGETRTVTQFHYLAWPAAGCPGSVKSLLEFRRKVNKSYRGRASPILVHCTDGAGRTGTYCLLDMVASRILHGVKELNIAGSLEHLRDQRMRMVATEQQYKLVFSGVAGEVNSLIKNLQH